MKPFAITSASLTRNGNLLINHPQVGWVFTNADGTFYNRPSEEYDRNEDENEVEFLLRVCPQITINTPIWYKPISQKVSEIWKSVSSIRVSEDFSNYDQSRCNNGGSYGFWTNAYLFVKTVTDWRGKKSTQFGIVEQCRTTADFHYTDSGSFQRECHSYIANDTETRFYHTEWGHGESEVSLENLPTFKTLTYKEVLEMFGTSVISDLANRNIFISNIIASGKRNARRGGSDRRGGRRN